MKGFTLYRSSAGSGKTYTLVKTYLSLLFSIESDYGFKQILAITFTNKAADEMKKRVFSALEKIVEEKIDNSLAKEIAQENNFDLYEIVKRAERIHNKILHNYGDFSLMTIDKFTNHVIRAFSNELGLSEKYEVILEENEFLEQGISEFIDQTTTNSFQLNLIQQFIDESIRQGVQNDIEKQLKKLNRIIFQSDFRNYDSLNPSDLLKLRNHFLAELKAKEDNLKFQCNNGELILKTNNIETTWQSYARLNKVFDAFNQLKTINYETIEKWSLWYEKEQWFKKSLKEDQWQVIEEVKVEINFAVKNILSNLFDWLKLIELHKFITPFSMVQALVQKIEIKKQQQNSIFISDFNFLISDIIKQEPAGFIFERIGSRYQYILVDEFQDTSQMQWENLIPLIHESLSNGGKNLIVGDAKQAIYRWRNGDVKQFINLPSISDNYLKSNYQQLISQSFDNKVLENNFRSSINIVEFNNWLFENVSLLTQNDNILEAFKDVAQNVKRDVEGVVNIKLKSKGEFDLKEYVSNIINDSLKKGYNYEDVALLIRSKKDGLKIVNVLEELNVPFTSEDSVFLSSSVGYKYLFYGLRYFEFKRENDFKLLIHFLEIYHGKESLNFTKIKSLITDFNFNKFLKLLDFQKLYFVLNLLDLSSQDPYIDVFVNTGLDKIKDEHFSLGEMLSFLDEKSNKITVECGSFNAVQIMTIHKSKGLEFPVVIIPFGSWPNRNSLNTPFVWLDNIDVGGLSVSKFIGELSKKSLYALGKSADFQREENALILDNLNLYYVAFTRAVDELYVAMNDSKSLNNVSDFLVSCLKQHDLFNDDKNDVFINGASKIILENKSILANKNSSISILNQKFEKAQIQEFFSFIDEPNLGTIFHDAISKVKDDFSAAYKYLQDLYNRGGVNQKIVTKCENFLKNIENSKELNFIFSDYKFVYNEREITNDSGEVLRLDRLIIKDDHVIVIDYKTNDGQLDKHKIQLNTYMKALYSSGYKTVVGYILYVSVPKLVEVSLKK
tara:strand:+ start:1835 stop:4867 length:3033 start_codon:yes stop_codon:yes gene_type:complete